MQPSESATTFDRIVEQATHLFVARGYNGISMREIAEAVGVSKAGLYYHFKDKEALFMAILTANLDQLEIIIQTARQEGKTTRGQIGQMMRAILAQAPDQRAIIQLASQEMANLSARSRTDFGRIYQAKFISQVEGILQAGIERGEIEPIDTLLATWVLLGMAYPFVSPSHEREPESAKVVDLIVSIFFDGAAK
jgi:AcrR family transcriptional regulator